MNKRLLGIFFSTLILTTGCSMDMDISEDIKRELETKYGVDWEDKLEKQYGKDWEDVLEAKYGKDFDDKLEYEVGRIYKGK